MFYFELHFYSIPGVAAPVVGETPVTTITSTSQYTGSVAWSPADSTFLGEVVYTATITLTPEAGYTFYGVSSDFFAVSGAAASNDAGAGVVTAIFPETDPAVIDIAAIPGLTPPVTNATPDTTITATSQYTGTVSWSPTDSPYAETTVYTATITLTPNAGFTLSGVSADFFTVAGATSVSNAADSGVITAVFPETGAIYAVGDIGPSGVGRVFYISNGGLNGKEVTTSNQGIGSWYNAVDTCAAYAGGGYGDWYLPSRSELTQVYDNRGSIGSFSTGYWSSTTYTSTTACIRDFSTGQEYTQTPRTGGPGAYYRAIRSF